VGVCAFDLENDKRRKEKQEERKKEKKNTAHSIDKFSQLLGAS